MTTQRALRRLGTSPITVGPIAYGCWRLADDDPSDVDTAHAKLETALDAGMNLIDTADIYGFGPDGHRFGAAEKLLGSVLRNDPTMRERMVIATKGGITPPVPYDSSRQYLLDACDRSLDRLGVDSVDLYQVHRPDLLAHPAEVAATLGEIVESGRARLVGVSNYTASQFQAITTYAPGLISTTQPELSLWHYEPIDDGVLDRAMEAAATPLAWSPLGRGAVGGSGTALADTIAAVAAELDVSTTAVAIAWVLRHPSRPVAIIGTQRPERIRDAATAASIELSRAQWYALVRAAGRDLP